MLSSDFYLQDDVVGLSRKLLGKIICTHIDNKFCSAYITETEAYAGIVDKASHAYGGRRTDRTEIMYAKGGVSYVYLCYGIHFLFNVVTNLKNIPHAILIRAIEPINGTEYMLERRGKKTCQLKDFTGPGKVSQALGIGKNHNGIQLAGDQIWIEDPQNKIDESLIQIGPRVGIDYAEEDADLPYRFQLKNHFKKDLKE